MKRFLLTFLVLAAVPLVAFGQKKTGRQEANLVGPVRSVVEKISRYGAAEREPRDTVIYDVKGNEVERVMVSDFGEVMGKQTHVIDAAGVMQETKFLDAKGKLRERTEYSYAGGRL
nr:hypothetical protein [Blastocatellia bacterium]